MDRVLNRMPLYLAMAVPAAILCVHVMGPVGGGITAMVANLVLWGLLLPPVKEEGVGDA